MAILNSPLQFIESIPQAARAFTATLVAFSLLNFILDTWHSRRTNYLILTPGLVLWRPWTLLTSPFVEVGLIEVRCAVPAAEGALNRRIQLVISLLFLPLSFRYVERLWGALETTKFVLITVVVSNVIAVFLNVMEHFIIGLDGLFLFVSHHSLFIGRC